jgi:TolB-like protein
MERLWCLVRDLRRRHVYRVAGIYVVASWVAVQVADTAFPGIGVPDAAIRYVWLAVFLGFPLALVFGWRYDITTQGIVRTPPADAETQSDLSLRRTDHVILALFMVMAAGVIYQLTTQISDSRSVEFAEIIHHDVDPNSIAVLPLDNLSGDPEQEYFVSGMHEALIADLSRISGLKVISRTSTEQFRDSNKPLPEIGTELGVANLIEGSVIRVGDQVRITVQLIDVATDEHLWAESYEHNLTNVLRLQSNVAQAIADQIKVTLTPHEGTLLAASAEVDPEAYEFYLKGRFHWYKFTEADLVLALEYFQLAIDKDPGYALAYVGFADALATPAHIGLMPTTQVYPAAKQSVQRALELDGDLAEAHDLLARIHFAYDWDWTAAERGFRRSISLNSGYPDVHIVYSQFLAVTNHWDESMAEVRRGLELDPLNPWFRLELAQRLAWFGYLDEATEKIRELIKSQPNFLPSYKSLWNIAYEQGQFEEAITAAGNYFRLLGETALAASLKDGIEDLEYSELMRRAADVLETQAARPYVSHIEHAVLRMHAGDLDKALDRLEQAHAQRESHLVYTIVEPLFRPVWNDERYKNLLHNMNYR